jgi:hypothetical protein
MGGFAVDLVLLSFKKDSAYQNTAEFIGIILSLLARAQLGIRDVDIEVMGDSKAALSWASTHCFKSPKATNASIVFILTCIAFGFTVRESVHIPGTKNWRADGLSRKVIGSTAVEDVMREIGLEHIPVAHIVNNQFVRILRGCCNPSRSMNDEDDFVALWGTIRDALRGLGGDRPKAGWAPRA